MNDLKENKSGGGIASLAIGLLGSTTWSTNPILGTLIAIVGLIFGIKGRKGDRPGLSVAGIILCIILLFASARRVLSIWRVELYFVYTYFLIIFTIFSQIS